MLVLFVASAVFATLGAFNRFSAAPLLCAFLILGYPALGGVVLPDTVPILITLLTEVVAFGYALAHYGRLRCLDLELVRRFAVPAAVAAAAGSVGAHAIAGAFRLSVWALLLLAVVGAWWAAPPDPEIARTAQERLATGAGPVRRVVTTDGATYVYVCARQEIGLLLTALGAFVTGLTSFGLGEVETANLTVRCRIPTRVAVGTGLAIALVAAAVAAVAHLAVFASRATPVPLWPVAATAPGAVAGTALGRVAARRVRQEMPVTKAVYVLLASTAVWVLVVALGHG
jgi:uncharacterized membrane protein YfcA